jgi:hypothetical protein
MSSGVTDLLMQARRGDGSVLGPQQKRLRQVALQMRGVFVFRDHEVVAALELTPGQRERLREIEGERFGPVLGIGPRRRPPPGPHSPEVVQRCLALRTPGCWTDWQSVLLPRAAAPARRAVRPPPPR